MGRSRYYQLVNKKTVPCTMHEWACAFEYDDRHVADTDIGESRISTIFLGLDHAMHGPALLFETMIFGGPMDKERRRCSTWDQAETMHEDLCTRVRGYSIEKKT